MGCQQSRYAGRRGVGAHGEMVLRLSWVRCLLVPFHRGLPRGLRGTVITSPSQTFQGQKTTSSFVILVNSLELCGELPGPESPRRSAPLRINPGSLSFSAGSSRPVSPSVRVWTQAARREMEPTHGVGAGRDLGTHRRAPSSSSGSRRLPLTSPLLLGAQVLGAIRSLRPSDQDASRDCRSQPRCAHR